MRAAAAKHGDSGSWSPVHAPAASDAAIQTGSERIREGEQESGQTHGALAFALAELKLGPTYDVFAAGRAVEHLSF